MKSPTLKVMLLLLAWPLTAGPGEALASRPLISEQLPQLPAPMSNNAVALVGKNSGVRLFSFFGLENGKTWRDPSASAWELAPGGDEWRPIGPLPGATGRLAAGAAVADGHATWVFGGYTVAEDGAEVSTPEVYRIDTESRTAEHVSDMPVPVDDMVVLAYRDRYIYLVSGWHDLGNVNLVQVLDTETLAWSQATPYPGSPVFGHAGGISGGRLLICGGVRIEYPADGTARAFLPSRECWLGAIDATDFRLIAWRPAPHHPGPPRYRAAAGADASGRIVFVGGSANPYNYDGIGYDGEPSEPAADILRYDMDAGQWETGWDWPFASMDHRNLPFHDGWFYLAGGMLQGQRLTRRVLRFRLDDGAPGKGEKN